MKDNLDIKEILFIYISIILTCWIIGLKFELSKSYDEKIEIMKITVKNDKLNQEYISVLQESREALNDEIDRLNLENDNYKHLERITKDISRHWTEK